MCGKHALKRLIARIDIIRYPFSFKIFPVSINILQKKYLTVIPYLVDPLNAAKGHEVPELLEAHLEGVAGGHDWYL